MFGLDYKDPIEGETRLISCEDDYERTVIPRLMGMGADISKIDRIDGTLLPKGKTAEFTLDQIEAIDAHLGENPDVRLLVIDPVGAYIGNRDDYKDADVRQLLGPLAEVASRRGVTVILVRHLNKSSSTQAMSRATGAGAWVAVCRAALLFAADAEEPEITIVAEMKNNLGPRQVSLAFRRRSLRGDEIATVLDAPQCDDLTDNDREVLGEQLFRPAWIGGTVDRSRR